MTKVFKLTGIDQTVTEAATSDLERNTYRSDLVVEFSGGRKYNLEDKEQLRACLQSLKEQLEDANKAIDLMVNTGYYEPGYKYLEKWGVEY